MRARFTYAKATRALLKYRCEYCVCRAGFAAGGAVVISSFNRLRSKGRVISPGNFCIQSPLSKTTSSPDKASLRDEAYPHLTGGQEFSRVTPNLGLM